MPQATSTPPASASHLKKVLGHLLWAVIAVAAAFCLAAIALNRGEHINSTWLVLAAACTYALGFRFYGKFIAARVMALNNQRATPAERLKTVTTSSLRTSGF